MSDWVLQTSRGIWYQEELLSELKILDSNDLVSNMQENKPGQTPQKFEVNGKAKKKHCQRHNGLFNLSHLSS